MLRFYTRRQSCFLIISLAAISVLNLKNAEGSDSYGVFTSAVGRIAKSLDSNGPDFDEKLLSEARESVELLKASDAKSVAKALERAGPVEATIMLSFLPMRIIHWNRMIDPYNEGFRQQLDTEITRRLLENAEFRRRFVHFLQWADQLNFPDYLDLVRDPEDESRSFESDICAGLGFIDNGRYLIFYPVIGEIFGFEFPPLPEAGFEEHIQDSTMKIKQMLKSERFSVSAKNRYVQDDTGFPFLSPKGLFDHEWDNNQKGLRRLSRPLTPFPKMNEEELAAIASYSHILMYFVEYRPRTLMKYAQ